MNNFKIYIPKNSNKNDSMYEHNFAYKKFVTTGNILQVTEDPNDTASFAICERESWEYFDPFFKKNNITYLPKFLCDKSLHTSYFAEAGMKVLPCRKVVNANDLNYFKNIPFLMKPSLSGGSSGGIYQYKFFTNLEHFSSWCESPGINLNIKEIEKLNADMIIQKSVALPNETYGQLYVEGFVNEHSEVHFSSTHEIEFMNGRWTKQLPWDNKDDEQLDDILSQTRTLIKNTSVKNTIFLLQFVRNFEEGIWYPTDWQYRLSYNSLWGRSHFEPKYVENLIKYMANVSDKVTSESVLKYYQSYVYINTDNTKQKLNDAMTKHNIVHIPFSKNSKDEANKFLFITANTTFDLAKKSMIDFANDML